MSERFDFIAINRRGVYALCEDLPDDPGGIAAEFTAKVEAKGHRIERVPVEEAVRRHREYLDNLLKADPALAQTDTRRTEG